MFFHQALELLPSTTKLRDILTFLENVMENQAIHRRNNQILKSMLYAENLQVGNSRNRIIARKDRGEHTSA